MSSFWGIVGLILIWKTHKRLLIVVRSLGSLKCRVLLVGFWLRSHQFVPQNQENPEIWILSGFPTADSFKNNSFLVKSQLFAVVFLSVSAAYRQQAANLRSWWEEHQNGSTNEVDKFQIRSLQLSLMECLMKTNYLKYFSYQNSICLFCD